MCRCWSLSASRRIYFAAASIVSSLNWWILMLAPLGSLIVTARISGFQARAVTCLAGHAGHEGADAIARKLALGFLVKRSI